VIFVGMTRTADPNPSQKSKLEMWQTSWEHWT